MNRFYHYFTTNNIAAGVYAIILYKLSYFSHDLKSFLLFECHQIIITRPVKQILGRNFLYIYYYWPDLWLFMFLSFENISLCQATVIFETFLTKLIISKFHCFLKKINLDHNNKKTNLSKYMTFQKQFRTKN